MAGCCTGQGSKKRERQQTLDGLNGSVCMQFLTTYLHSLKHRMVYNTPKYVANSGLSSLRDPSLNTQIRLDRLPAYLRGEHLGESININIIDLMGTWLYQRIRGLLS